MSMRINEVLAQFILCFFSIFFLISIGTGIYFVYYKYMSRNKVNASKYNYIYKTTIW